MSEARTAAEIEHMVAETRKFVAEQQKLFEEQQKLAAERDKLRAEERKLEQDRWWHPWLQLLLSGATLLVVVIGALLHFLS